MTELNRTELREKDITTILEKYFNDPIDKKCPYCEATKELLALFDQYAEAIGDKLDQAKIDIAELSKKLDDREADLINAKKEERERILDEEIIADTIEADGEYTPRGAMILAREIIQALKDKEE